MPIMDNRLRTVVDLIMLSKKWVSRTRVVRVSSQDQVVSNVSSINGMLWLTVIPQVSSVCAGPFCCSENVKCSQMSPPLPHTTLTVGSLAFAAPHINIEPFSRAFAAT
jgi:hypothetical protein